MKPVIIFDLGKVLVDFDYNIAAEKISTRCLNPPPTAHIFHNLAALLMDYETGLITRESFYEAVRTTAGFQGTLAEFSEYFAKIFAPIPAMIQLQADLRRSGHRTYIFSNTNDLAIEHIRQDYPFFTNFDGYILSYEIKAMKPNPPIYEAMELMSGQRGADLIYIDDRLENIEAGGARGWRTVLHETPEKTLDTLRSFGLTV